MPTLVSKNNNFLINDLLPVFGLNKGELKTFQEYVFWLHTCNCYPWYRKYNTSRNDRIPTELQIVKCLGGWLEKIKNIESIKGIVLMGFASTYMFPELYGKNEKFKELVRKNKVRNDIIKGKDIIPIFHQSKKSRVFNIKDDKQKNEEIKKDLQMLFKKWIS